MSYRLSLRIVGWKDTPVVEELSEDDGRLSVLAWLERLLAVPRDRVFVEDDRKSLAIASIRSMLASEVGHLLADLDGALTPVDVKLPVSRYAVRSRPAEDASVEIPLAVGWSLGTPPLALGAEDSLGLLDADSVSIQSAMPPTFEDRFALVLGGGGAKGAAQAGAMKALIEVLDQVNEAASVGAQIHYIVGTSIGAFNALFLSANRMAELEQFWNDVHPLTGLSLVNELRSRVPKTEMRIPVEVSRVNLQEGRAEFHGLESEDIYDEVRKSMRLPPLFPAVSARGAQYVDGGVLVNLPVARCVQNRCYWIIVLGLDDTGATDKRFFWPIGQGFRALALQGKELQRFQRLLLLASGQMQRLAGLADLGRCTVDDLMFISGIRRRFFTMNVIVVPLKDCISARTAWFSGKTCRKDFADAYDFAKTFLSRELLPLAQNFAGGHGSPAT